jgi:multiple sugar transport system substrate-binding protein
MSHSRTPHRRARLTLAATVAAALTLTATACGDSGGDSGAEGRGTGKIVFWDNNGGVRTAVWKQIIAAFEKKYPDIKVEYVGIPIADVQKKYDTAAAGGGLPDVGGVGTAYLADLVAQGVLEPVGDRIAGSSLKGKLVSGMVAGVRAAGGRDTEMYAVPTSANEGTIWYRTDLFTAAGLQPPTTWAAFYQAASRLTAAGDNKFGFTIRGGKGAVAQALDMMYAQSGIPAFWKDGRTTVDDPANVAALEKYVGLYRKATPEADLNNDFVNMVAEFDQGTIGMLQHNLGSYTDHVKAFGKDRIEGIPLPPPKDGGPHTVVSNPVDGLGLFTSGKNKAAAWKFIEFAASAPMNSLWNESAGAIPANTDAAAEPAIQNAGPTRTAMDNLNDPATTVVQLPYHLPDWNSISKADSEPEFQKLLLGKISAKDFAGTLADKLNAAQADYDQHKG